MHIFELLLYGNLLRDGSPEGKSLVQRTWREYFHSKCVVVFLSLETEGEDESDSGMKQVVMGILDPVLSGAWVGTGILLETYNLLTRVVPRV